jgi:hypothetical protein
MHYLVVLLICIVFRHTAGWSVNRRLRCPAATTNLVVETIETDNLRTTATYAILAKTDISTVPATSIIGNIAVSPISVTAITGFRLIMDSTKQFSTSTQVNNGGKVFAPDYTSPTPSNLIAAVNDMETAYTEATGRTNNDDCKVNLGGGGIGGLTSTELSTSPRPIPTPEPQALSSSYRRCGTLCKPRMLMYFSAEASLRTIFSGKSQVRHSAQVRIWRASSWSRRHCVRHGIYFERLHLGADGVLHPECGYR